MVVVYPGVPLPAHILPGTTSTHRKAFEMCVELARAVEDGDSRKVGELLREHGLS